MKTIIYNIASYSIAIKTESPDITVKILENFEPFRTDNTVGEILFTIKGKCEIAYPKTKAIDIFEYNSITYEVFKDESSFTVSMTKNGKRRYLKSEADWKNPCTDADMTNFEDKMYINDFIVIAFNMTSSKLKTLKLHASVIEKDGKALLFMGKSGTGKSTHSRLWQEFIPDCRLLNDDEPIVRLCDDGVVRVYGSPWSGKTRCYRNISAEVSAFVHLYQSPNNVLRKLNVIDSVSSLMFSSCTMRTDKQNKTNVFNTIADILSKVNVYRLDCLPDKSAVMLTHSLLK